MLRIVNNTFLRRRRIFFSIFIFVTVLLFLHHEATINSKIKEKYQISQKSETQFKKGSIYGPTFQTSKFDTFFHNYFQNNNSSDKNTVKYKMGNVNVHLWRKICSRTIDSLKEHPLFPHWPDVRGCPKMPDNLISIMSEMWCAQRVMGLFHPPVTGSYRFEIISVSMAEMWLSSSTDPGQASLMTRINKNNLHGVLYAIGEHIPKSRAVFLQTGHQYYFEMLHIVNEISYGTVELKWMMPGSDVFTKILNHHISTVMINDKDLDNMTRLIVERSPSIRSGEALKKPKKMKWNYESRIVETFGHNFSKSFTLDELRDLEFVNRTRIIDTFDQCAYSPSYTRKRHFRRYEGVYHTHFSDVFPADDTGGKIWQGYSEVPDRHGNTLIEESVVIDVARMFMSKLEDKHPGEFLLVNIIKVERNVDAVQGNRFLLDFVLQDQKTNTHLRVSEYVFLRKNSSVLCMPEGMFWSPKVMVNVIITTKNQGPWVENYIKSMARVINETRDEWVKFITVDYGNNGVVVEDEFRRNGVTNFEIIKKKGKFHKTSAIEIAVNTIKDPNSIVFLTDLHLHVPNDIFDSVRRHTIQGKMCYTPVVFRLTRCSRPETEETPIAGYWDSYAFGIFSAFKSDWTNFGGLNIREFGNKWGGEDWEMVDRVLAKGLEIERLRLPYFYHFYHDKHNMWDRAL